jgi:hypothetical protein
MADTDITGTVFDESGSPQAGATVALMLTESESEVVYTTTDSNGDYQFVSHPDGDGSPKEWHVVGYYEDNNGQYNGFSEPYVLAEINNSAPSAPGSNAFPETSTFWNNWTPSFDFSVGPQDRFVGVVESPDSSFAQGGTAISVKNSSANAQYTLDTVSPPLDFSGFSTLNCKIETENTSFRADETGQPMRFKINGNTVFEYTGNPDDKSGFQQFSFDISSAGANSTISIEGQVISTTHAGQTILRVGDLVTT